MLRGRSGGGGGPCAACLWDSVASAWVDFYHAAFVSRQALARENEQLRICAIQKDLAACKTQLGNAEQKLQDKILQLEREAVHRKRVKDLNGAKLKMMERRRTQARCLCTCWNARIRTCHTGWRSLLCRES
jgi:hypothetical protein